MATVTSSRTYGNPPIQTTTKVDTDTGKSEIFIFVDGEEKLAATGIMEPGILNLDSEESLIEQQVKVYQAQSLKIILQRIFRGEQIEIEQIL